jgi:hypothetical protein
MGKAISGVVQIAAPKFQTATFVIRGTAPFVQERFPQKAVAMMRAKHEAGSVAKKGQKREARDFDADFMGSMYLAADGKRGIPCNAIRCAMISACRLVGFKMTLAKLSVQVVPEGFDINDNTPLFFFLSGEPHMDIRPVRNATGVADLRSRAMWNSGWTASVVIKFDADQFTGQDVGNLLLRVGEQVGIGAGRPDSKESCGLGWGTFELVNPE